MSIRKTPFVNNEYYHIYNRGIDKRIVFKKNSDYQRFMESVLELNTKESCGGLYKKTFLEKYKLKQTLPGNKLIDIIAYCLNDNHYHFIIKQLKDGGISKFMQKLGTGYTMYFNNQNRRSGSLFQGKFKSKHIDSNEYLLYLSAYVNLNNRIHSINDKETIVFSSLKEYTEDDTIENVCEKSIILDQYKNKKAYKKFLEDSLPDLVRQKEQKMELNEYFLE